MPSTRGGLKPESALIKLPVSEYGRFGPSRPQTDLLAAYLDRVPAKPRKSCAQLRCTPGPAYPRPCNTLPRVKKASLPMQTREPGRGPRYSCFVVVFERVVVVPPS